MIKKFLNLKSYILNLKSSINFFDKKINAGFTLVEMIVAVALFSLVMVIGMGALLNVLNANRQAQSIQTAVNNLNLAMEMMSREIRTGYYYHCGDTANYHVPRNCSNGSSFMAFESYKGDINNSSDQIIFKLFNQRIYKSVDSGTSFLPLTSEKLVLEDLDFIVVGAPKNDGKQPKVLIIAKGYVGERLKERTYFNLQTTISQRMIDY
jgi:prepilin-type N-terminal cleavage/methylation domain-containing protein